MSPKSPVDFVQYHQRHQPEYPPLEDDYGFQRTASRSRTRKARNFRSLDFEVGIREDTSSNYSEAPPYHQYPEEDQWEDRGSGKRREREQPKAGVETDHGTTYGEGPYLQMGVFDARHGRGEASLPPHPGMNLHPYVATFTSPIDLIDVSMVPYENYTQSI
jgi:hypothetical protein